MKPGLDRWAPILVRSIIRPQSSGQHSYPGAGGSIGNGVPGAAGKPLFAEEFGGNPAAYHQANGRILWHTRLGQVSDAPETYMLEGHEAS